MPDEPQQLDQGTYQVIRQRLDALALQLRERVDKLNAARREVFGGIELKLTGSDRITTPHNCVPRDMAAVGRRFLFGFNVHFGLKQQITPSDVFAVYRFDGKTFHAEPLDLIADDAFRKDFTDLYRYYKDARFAKFFRQDPHLYMKLRVGRDADDFKAFKWATLPPEAPDDDAGDVALRYLDNRSDSEVRYPRQSPFDWKRATRDMQRRGPHPHLSIEDLLFIECVGGDLTIKVEDNTASGQGIYSEPVDNPDQTLDDAEVNYVVQGPMVMLKVRPFQEREDRYFLFNTKTREVIRQDAIATACQLLPEDHGIIFPTGFYLTSGVSQTFPNTHASSVYERTLVSPNGEDFLYVFYERNRGVYTLMPYNLIERRVDTPIVCSGHCVFDDGTLILFKTHAEAQKHHAIQVWQTPFHGPDYQRNTPHADSLLYKIGNRDIVRGMAECAQLLQLIERDELYQDLYLDIVETASGLVDAYHWLNRDETFNLGEVVGQVREAGQAAVGEYEKLQRTRRATADAIDAVESRTQSLINDNAARVYDRIDPFVEALSGLRQVRGEVIALRDLKYADAQRIDGLEAAVDEQTQRISRRTVEFLLEPGSLDPYEAKAAGFAERIDGLKKVTEADELGEAVDAAAAELEMLIDIVGNLDIEDATQRTAIIERVSAVFTTINAARAGLKNKRAALGEAEGAAEFASQLKLISQSVANYLDLSDTPEATDDYLTRVMVQIEELEGRFAEFDVFVVELADKRNEVLQAFESRKLQLQEARSKRAEALGQAAERVLSGIAGRVERMESVAEINSYLSGDLMIDKARRLVEQLRGLGDTVKADDIQGRLKTIREEAVRQLKDRKELQADGKNTIRFGRHVFSVNTQPVDLTTVVRDGVMHLHVTGTRFYEPIDDPALNALRPVWDQPLVSENDKVYRAEYLAYLMMADIERLDASEQEAVAWESGAERLARVQAFMAPRYREGYTKGVHDADAAAILGALLDLSQKIGLLRYPSRARALASVFWQALDDRALRERLADQLAGFGRVLEAFPDTPRQQRYIDELNRAITSFAADAPAMDASLAPLAAEYLFRELTRLAPVDTGPSFVMSPQASDMVHAFLTHLRGTKQTQAYQDSVDRVDDPLRKYALIHDWADAFAESRAEASRRGYVAEAAALLLEGTQRPQATRLVDVEVTREITGLAGSHPRLDGGTLRLDYHDVYARLDHFAAETVPAFDRFQAVKQAVLEAARDEMRVGEFRPKVLTSFVRNRLIDEVLLPLIGDNLAKQMGTAGEDTRTDRMGLLLLISPPGYGKTTLMEYVAARLGVVFMKINGPALGHNVTSLDPEEAPNAAAREELHKLNLAFEMGDNVVIYVDDIQHTNSEFLQKFISLCDATRRIEGVFRGKPRTYDLRGRKVAVVMAGNPYTESGERFRLPDMLTNRADTYNLGDIIGEHGEAFRVSYLENSLTSNPSLNGLAARSQSDVHQVIKIARTGSRDGVDFEAAFTSDEVDEMVKVMEKLIRVRDVVLRVNQEYIKSAGMEEEYRTEPPFLLQGSYRNMNRIAERVVPVMNDEELTTLIESSYEQDAQTLTTGAEANLLKFRSLFGWFSEEGRARWEAIVRSFQRINAVRSMGGDDRTAAVLAQLGTLTERLQGIDRTLGQSLGEVLTGRNGEKPTDLTPLVEQMAAFVDRLGGIRDAIPRAPEVVPASPGGSDGAAAREPYEIKVVNKVPATFLYVLKEQFDLMKGWLEPLTRITADQDEKLAQMSRSIENIVGRYDRIIDDLESDGEAAATTAAEEA